MGYKTDFTEAKNADRSNQSIKTSGKYVGIITRAEKLLSKKGTEGVGFSFKTDTGDTANYLDLYTVNAKGEKLQGLSTLNAILCCAKLRGVEDGIITFEKWDKDAKAMVETKAEGYPDLMGKRIGFLLQQELSTHIDTGTDVERVNIYGVFEADTGFTASEIVDKATKPEKLDKMLTALMARPVYDRREKPASNQQAYSNSSSAFDDNEAPF
jgi:hypothetical protein